MRSGAGRGVAGLAILLCAGLPHAGQAQRAEAPARVARVSRIEGVVSFHPAGAVQWTPATLNLPVTTGTALWTEPGAQADIGFPGTRLALDGGSELDMDVLDAHRAATSVPQGAAYIVVQLLPAGDTLTVQTPRGIVSLPGVGRYEVVAGDAARPTTVTVVEGSADVAAAGLLVRVGLNQTATLTGDGGPVPFAANLGVTVPDAFLTERLAVEQPSAAPRPSIAPAYVAEMTGGEALDGVGSWDSVPDYGAVWFPPVGAGFVPYREGWWAWLAPLGWTWVDEAPWGFAPFHYGRWMQVRDRWGWVPGPVGRAGFRPAYVPAAVGFLGGAALAGAVGWFPLGPRDLAAPFYRTGPGVPRMPAGSGPGFANRSGATVVPWAVMASGGRVAGAIQAVPGVSALPVVARPAFTPTAATPGITPAVVRQFRLPSQAVPGAPGPAIGPGPARGVARGALRLAQGPGQPQSGSVTPLAVRPGAAVGIPSAPRPGRAAALPGPGAAEAPTPGVIRPLPGIERPGEASRAPLPTVIGPDRPVQTEMRGREPPPALPEGLHAGTPGGLQRDEATPGALGRPEGRPGQGGAGFRPEFAPRPSLPRPSVPAFGRSPGIGFR